MEKKKKDYSLHVFLRYSEHMAPESGTIKSHEDLIMNHGAVWFGKFGKRIGVPMTDVLEKQIKEKKPVYLFLAIKKDGNYKVHAGVVEKISQSTKEVDSKLVPTYYKQKKWMVKTWFKILKFIPLDPEILRILNGKTSKLPLIESIRSSMSPSIYATLDNKVNLEKFVKKSI